MPHGSDKACHARLTQIDPIPVWINAERRWIGTQQKKSCGIVPAALMFERGGDVSANVRR
jgi:hypothetical protein